MRKIYNNMMNMTNTYGYYITLVNGIILVVVLMIDFIAGKAETKIQVR